MSDFRTYGIGQLYGDEASPRETWIVTDATCAQCGHADHRNAYNGQCRVRYCLCAMPMFSTCATSDCEAVAPEKAR